MSIVKDISRGLAPYLVLAGIAGVIWLYRDKIADWFSSAITAPVTKAVGGVVQAGQQAAETPIVVVGQDSYTVGEAARGWNPLTFMASLPGQALGVAGNVVRAMLSGGSTESYQPTIAPVLQGTAVPSEADILWQAKLAEVGPVPSGPAPSGYRVRGTSLTGAPLYEPIQAMLGTLELPDAPGTVAQIWQLGPSKLLQVGDVWLGENISACYLSGGWWDAPRGRCIW